MLNITMIRKPAREGMSHNRISVRGRVVHENRRSNSVWESVRFLERRHRGDRPVIK